MRAIALPSSGQSNVITFISTTAAAHTVTIAQQVGAFALPSGSKDAALVVTLAPGPYTVVVTDRNGATGVPLVEVYLVP